MYFILNHSNELLPLPQNLYTSYGLYPATLHHLFYYTYKRQLLWVYHQDSEYIENVLPVEVRKIVVEASSSYSWNKLIYNSKYLITQDNFGASGKKNDVYKKFGFDVDTLEEKIESLLK